ncbi:hypothetical protein ATANTOWER_018957 [Ataeniobius toweri]|uniref:Uncharacterized protein n=1 Tax=Ataeniobius toweri TaxID=208326 RepID=A0ABU7BZM3_9TELE|nr:hypothetical protein [Ataeniobius toweri]
MSQKSKTNNLEALETILQGSDLEVEECSDSSADFEVDEDEDRFFFFGTRFTTRRRQDHLALKDPAFNYLG